LAIRGYTTTPQEALSREIADRRAELKLKQKEVAEFSSSSVNFISEVERGNTQPSIEKTWAIAEALKMKPSGLWIRAELLLEENPS